MSSGKSYIVLVIVWIVSLLATAFFITGVGGLILDKKGFKLPEQVLPVAVALLVGGICFVGIEWWLRGHSLSNEVTWTVALAVGIGQLIAAVFPGASRSGTTILLSLLLGLNRPVATTARWRNFAKAKNLTFRNQNPDPTAAGQPLPSKSQSGSSFGTVAFLSRKGPPAVSCRICGSSPEGKSMKGKPPKRRWCEKSRKNSESASARLKNWP